MLNIVSVTTTSIELGLLYTPLVIGVFLTFRILNFPDLTAEGSFVTGAAVTAIAISGGVPGILAIFIGAMAGFVGGGLTAFLHIFLGVGKILSGILSLSMLYTINLRLMHGPNISLINQPNIIGLFKTPMNHFNLIFLLIIFVTLSKFAIDWFLQTELGLRLRATGDNELTAQSFAINTKFTKFIGMGLSNAFIGMAGGLIAQYQGFSDISMGTGVVILGLASLIMSEVLISNGKITIATFAIVIGAILYQLIVNFALQLGLLGTDIKLVTALIVVISLFVGSNKKYSFYGKKLFNN